MSSASAPATSRSATASTTRSRTSAASQPEDAQQEGREEDLDADDDQRGSHDSDAFIRQRAQAVGDPRRHDDTAERQADQHEGAAQQQTVLQPETGAHA